MPDDDLQTTVNDDVAAAFDSVEEAAGEVMPEVDDAPIAAAADAGVEGEGAGGDEAARGTEAPVSGGAGAAPQGDGGAAGAAPEAITAPEHWSPEHRATFDKLPADGQRFLAERHRDMEAAYTRASQEIAPLREMVGQYNGYFTQIGRSPEQMFRGLMEYDRALRFGTPPQKAQAIQELANGYGVELGGIAQGDAQDVSDPLQEAINERLAPFMQTMQSFAGTQQQQQAAQQQALVQHTSDQIGQFAGAKDAEGNAAHPHFDEVVDDMARMAQSERSSGRQPDLQNLYETAIWANPTTRAKLIAAHQGAAQQTLSAIRSRKLGGPAWGLRAEPVQQPKWNSLTTCGRL